MTMDNNLGIEGESFGEAPNWELCTRNGARNRAEEHCTVSMPVFDFNSAM
jgi:hypothetical protein